MLERNSRGLSVWNRNIIFGFRKNIFFQSKMLILILLVLFNQVNGAFESFITDALVNLSYQKTRTEAFETIERMIYRNNFTAIYCGQTLPQYTSIDDVHNPFHQFYSTENRKYIYNQQAPTVTNYKSGFLVSFELETIMHVKMKRTVNVSYISEDYRLEKIGNIYFVRLDYGGACIDSQNFDKNLVESTWIVKNDTVGNVTGRDFMKMVIEEMPFVENFNTKWFSDSFFGLKNHYLHQIHLRKQDLIEHVHFFQLRYQLRRDLEILPIPEKMASYYKKLNIDTIVKTDIVTEHVDHIVFKMSRIFENKRNPQIKELWNYQIELTYNVDDDNKWKITKLFISHPIHHFNIPLTDYINNFWEDYVAGWVRTIETIGTDTYTLQTYYEVFHFLKYIKVEEEEPTFKMFQPKRASEVVTNAFRSTPIYKLKFCLQTIDDKLEGPIDRGQLVYFKFNIKCIYEHGVDDVYAVRVDFVAQYLDTWEAAHLHSAKLKRAYRTEFPEKKLDETYFNEYIFALNASSLIIGQSNVDFVNWQNNVDTLMSYINNEKFEYIICDRPSKGSEGFRKYLDRSRRKNQYLKMTPVYDIVSYTPFVFKLKYITLNYMYFVSQQIYYMTIEKSENHKFEITKIKLFDSCITDDDFNPNSVFPLLKRTEVISSQSQFIDEIQKTFLRNMSDDHYALSFKAIIETNPDTSQVYDLKLFKQYIKYFLDQNRIQNETKKTIISEEKESVVVKFSITFDEMIRNRYIHSSNEYFFIIRAHYLRTWDIVQLTMTPSPKLLENDIVQRKASLNFMLHIDEDYLKIINKLVNNTRIVPMNLTECETKEHDYTPAQTVIMIQRLANYLKEGEIQGDIKSVRTSEPFKIGPFNFKITYYYTINGAQKYFDVIHEVDYDYTFNIYRSLKMHLGCPTVSTVSINEMETIS